MHFIDRRTFIGAGATAAVAMPAWSAVPPPKVRLWTLDNLKNINGAPTRFEGDPTIVSGPHGSALAFDGKDDAIFIDEHPLAGAVTYTMEAIFRPDGGAFEQRWLHLESFESPSVDPGKSQTRMLFEIRVVEDKWYLDAFMTGPGYRQAMMAADKLFPLGRWYHVAQTYDGRTFRSYVDGALQMQIDMPFTPQGPGRASVGVRLNRVNHFHGAVREVRFTHSALSPSAFTRQR